MVLLRSPSAQALKNATCLTPGKAVLARKEVVHHDESGGWLFFNRRIRKFVVRAPLFETKKKFARACLYLKNFPVIYFFWKTLPDILVSGSCFIRSKKHYLSTKIPNIFRITADQLHPLNDEKYILCKNDYLDFLSGLRPILAGYRREWV